MVSRRGTCPPAAASESSIGESSAMVAPPINTARSGVSANSTAAFSQPSNSPRLPSNKPQMMKMGPSASIAASAIRATSRTPTVPSNNSKAESQSRSGPDAIEPVSGIPAEAASVAAAACATTAKIVSSRSANSDVALPLVPMRRLAIWSGAPTSRFQTTDW